jgi:hypothetical protein
MAAGKASGRLSGLWEASGLEVADQPIWRREGLKVPMKHKPATPFMAGVTTSAYRRRRYHD